MIFIELPVETGIGFFKIDDIAAVTPRKPNPLDHKPAPQCHLWMAGGFTEDASFVIYLTAEDCMARINDLLSRRKLAGQQDDAADFFELKKE